MGASYSHADMLKFDNLYVLVHRSAGTRKFADLMEDPYLPLQTDQERLHPLPPRETASIPRLFTEVRLDLHPHREGHIQNFYRPRTTIGHWKMRVMRMTNMAMTMMMGTTLDYQAYPV